MTESGDIHFSLIDLNRMTFVRKGRRLPLTMCIDNIMRMSDPDHLYPCMVSYAAVRGLDLSRVMHIFLTRLKRNEVAHPLRDFIKKHKNIYYRMLYRDKAYVR